MPVTRTFETTSDFFAAVLGPTQHDAHVRTRHLAKCVADRNAWLDAADKSLKAGAAEMIAQIKARRQCLEIA